MRLEIMKHEFDNMKYHEKMSFLNEIYQDLLKDMIEVCEFSKKLDLLEEYKQQIRDALEVIYNVETGN